MADTKISALPAASELTGSEEFAVNQGGVSKKATATQVKALADPDGTTITGALYRTRETGDRLEIGPSPTAPSFTQIRWESDNPDILFDPDIIGSGAGVVPPFVQVSSGSETLDDDSGDTRSALVHVRAQSSDGVTPSRAQVQAQVVDLDGEVDVLAMRNGTVGIGTFRDSVDARVTAVAPTVTMTTGGVGTGAFRDAVDARANAMLAARMQAGTASSGTVVAATAKTVTVTFPTAFSSAPKVTLTGISSDPGVDRRVSVVPGSETTTQFQVAFWRATGTASFDTNWLAVKP